MTKISVIIPVFNEEKDILPCLESLAQQTHNDFEVIVIDDGSTDKTIDSIAEFNTTKFKLTILEQKHGGPAMARNLGAKHATGKILVFVDADMTFDKKFLHMLVAPIVAEKSKGTFSRDEYVSNWDNAWARCWNINENLPKKKRVPKNYPDKHLVFRSILKTEFDRVGGFDKGGYTDDYTLSTKLGYRATVATHAFYYHKNPSTLVEVIKHSKWVIKRRYKFGVLGYGAPIVRNFPLIALVIGVIKAIWYREPKFVIFKLAYACGAYMGLFEMLVKRKLSK